MAVGAEVKGVEETNAKLDRIPPGVQDRLRVAVAGQIIALRDRVKEAIAEIFHSTGPLYKSVRAEMTEEPGKFTGRVYTEGVRYAAAQEFGGTWMIPEIFPVNAKVLAFMAPHKMGFSSGGGINGMIFTKRVRAHPVTLPARSYARSTLFRMRSGIEAAIRAAALGTEE